MEDDDSRLIAFVGNWQTCPTESQWGQYTHIIIAFAVSYTWSPAKNFCSTTCDIAAPPVCGNSPNPGLISQWKDAGKKVLLSFGGAGMVSLFIVNRREMQRFFTVQNIKRFKGARRNLIDAFSLCSVPFPQCRVGVGMV